MNKKSAMSAMGYAIVAVIVLGIIMIVSAPMLVTNVKDEKKSEPEVNYEREVVPQDNSELRAMEERLSSRIDDLERRQANRQENTVTDEFVCSIEGKLDDIGDGVPVDIYDKTSKIVFVCEYRQ